MSAQSATRSVEVYHHHWLAFWRQAAGISLLIVLGIASAVFWQPVTLTLTLVFWSLALGWATVAIHHWGYHTFSFTPDNRLICRYGLLGARREIISLLGKVSPSQPALVGAWLDVGSVRINSFGDEANLRCIGSFRAFYQRLISDGSPERAAPQTPVQVIVHYPGSPPDAPAAGGPVTNPGPRASTQRFDSQVYALDWSGVPEPEPEPDAVEVYRARPGWTPLLFAGLASGGLAVVSALGLWPGESAANLEWSAPGTLSVLIGGTFVLASTLYVLIMIGLLGGSALDSTDVRVLAFVDLAISTLIVATLALAGLALVGLLAALSWPLRVARGQGESSQ